MPLYAPGSGPHNTSHEDGGADEIDATGLTGAGGSGGGWETESTDATKLEAGRSRIWDSALDSSIILDAATGDISIVGGSANPGWISLQVDTGAVVEVQGDGLVVPVLAADPASGIDGQIFYRSDLDVFRVRVNGAWVSLSTAAAHAASHQNGGADEISIAGLDGTPAELTAHLTNAADAHDASAISIVDVGTLITATDVEGALQEIAAASASAHIADATDAHDASAVSFDDTGLTITAADVQTMGEQLDAAIAAGGIPATIFDAKGDIIVASAADTAVRMAAGADYTVPRWRAAATNGLEAVFPPGYEFDYAQITSPVTVTGTSIGATTDIVTGSSVAYDGSTIIEVKFFAPAGGPDPTAVGRDLRIFLFDGASEIGMLVLMQTGVTQVTPDFNYVPIIGQKRLTPSAASHTYSIKAFRSGGDGVVQAGAGTTSLLVPAYIRITKV